MSSKRGISELDVNIPIKKKRKRSTDNDEINDDEKESVINAPKCVFDESKISSQFSRSWKCTKCHVLYLNTNNMDEMCKLDGYPRPGSKYDTTDVKIWFNMKKKDLKVLCRIHGVGVSGNQATLVYRLFNYYDKLKSKKGKPLSLAKVNKLLKTKYNIDVKKDTISNCIKAGISNGYIKTDNIDNLDDIIYKEKCDYCKHVLTVSFRDALYQNDDGTKNGNIKNGPAKCPTNKNCRLIGYYISGYCDNNPILTEPVDHKHCMKCKNISTSMCIKPTNINGTWFDHCPKCEKRLKQYTNFH